MLGKIKSRREHKYTLQNWATGGIGFGGIYFICVVEEKCGIIEEAPIYTS
ncbi:hypothetical protein LX64_01904 [Chitinophaga skermanii]|uniref:Uncharacterized protein n=1 Tax=Chitinophaga skermanii TaxID=331697 RepID=A0A327QYN5_9BACT|nr:hypothetical protein LX64_01904 [Chitinophaga skermanii]